MANTNHASTTPSASQSKPPRIAQEWDTSNARWRNIPKAQHELENAIRNQSGEPLTVARTIASTISSLSSPFGTPRALLVGGIVRDSVLGLAPKDVDLEVYGIRVEDLESYLRTNYGRCLNTVGEAFGVFKLNIGNGHDIDISIPRRDSKQGNGHRGFQITGDPSMGIREAAQRRDFSWNALAADPISGEIFDFFGGIDDLRSGLLRVTSPELFTDDPLRILRAAQFTARMNLSVDKSSFYLMHNMVNSGALSELPAERITEEIKKLLLKGSHPSRGLELMRELGIFARHFPEIDNLFATPQDPEWHPEGDAGTHTLLCVDRAREIISRAGNSFSHNEQLQIMFGTLMHDLGKPNTTSFSDGRFRSPGHEAAGVKPARAVFSRLSLSNDVVTGALKCTEFHMRPGELVRLYQNGQLNEKQFLNHIRKLIRSLTSALRLETFLAVCEADYRGRDLPAASGPYLYGDAIMTAIASSRNIEMTASPLIRGKDLIEMGLMPGAHFGKIIQEAEAQRDTGRITDQDSAIRWVRQRYLLKGKDFEEAGIKEQRIIGSIMTNIRAEINAGQINTRSEALRRLYTLSTSIT